MLTFDNNRAVVKADIQDRKVSISVIGDRAGRRRLLAVIRSDFAHIHHSIARLRVEEKVPVPGHPGAVVEYETLRVLEAEGETEWKLVTGGKLFKLNVPELLSGVEEVPLRLRDIVHLVFSYSHEDEELRDQLETHLKLLQRQGVISTWHDRKIKPGDKWKDIIDENFKRADLILLLVSANFIASDYCYEIEMQTSLERHEKGEAKVIPVILRECRWQKAPFGKLQALPKDGKAVMNWSNRDKAWTNIVEGIENATTEIRHKRG